MFYFQTIYITRTFQANLHMQMNYKLMLVKSTKDVNCHVVILLEKF